MSLLDFKQNTFNKSVFNLFKIYAPKDLDLVKQSSYAFKISAPLREKAYIIFKIGNSLGIRKKDLEQIAFASELMTAASLTSDDIFDESLLRENKLSLYSKIDSERTYFVSEFMYGVVFKTLFDLPNRNAYKKIVDNFIKSHLDIQKGQYLTCNYKNKLKTLTPKFMDELAYIKVGSHFEASASAPAYLNGNKDMINSFRLFGKYTGIALMHSNDIADFCWSKDDLGRIGLENLFGSQPNLVLSHFLKSKKINLSDKKLIVNVWESGNQKQISRTRIKEIINKSGAIDLAKKHLITICNKAKKSLDKIKDSKLKKDLFEIIETIQDA